MPLEQPCNPQIEWYWERSLAGPLAQAWGPAHTMLGLGLAWFLGGQARPDGTAWVAAESDALQVLLADQQAFSGFAFSRVGTDGRQRHFSLSGEPVFDADRHCIGHRGMGIETTGVDVGPLDPADPMPGLSALRQAGAPT